MENLSESTKDNNVNTLSCAVIDDVNLQYVHQFQNLYYALTSIELSADPLSE